MYRLTYSPKSLADIKDIKCSISESYGVDTAKLTLKKIINSIGRLKQFPNSGQELSRIIDVQTDYWYMFTEKNYVFYRIEGSIVRIVRVLNERQDFMQILFAISTISDDDEYKPS